MLPTEENKGYAITSNIYKALGYREHRMLKKVVTDNIDKFEQFGSVMTVTSSPGEFGGRPSESFALNLDHLLLLAGLSKNTDRKKEILGFIVDAYSRSSLMSVLNLISSIDVDDLDADRYVYVAKEEFSGRYKIGISKNPDARIKQLNTGNPEKLILVHAYLAVDSGYKSEAIAHSLFEDSRLKGEWFSGCIDLSKLPSYNLVHVDEDPDCNCKDCSDNSCVYDSIADLGEMSRDEFISKAISDTGFDFDTVAKHVDALEDLGVIAFANIIGKSCVHDLQLEHK